MIDRKCEACGVSFPGTIYNYEGPLWCSLECYAQHNQPRWRYRRYFDRKYQERLKAQVKGRA